MNINSVQLSGNTVPAAAVKIHENAKPENHEAEATKRPAAQDNFISSRQEADDIRYGSKLSAEAVKQLKEHAEKTLSGLVEKMIRAQKKHEDAQGLDLATLARAMGLGAEAGLSDIQSIADGLQLGIDVSGMSYGEIADALGIGTAPESAAKAISEDGMWGVNTVSTRLMDMAIRLSGGDSEKIAELREAVQKGFEAVGALDTLPQVCRDTYAETMARFDYWETNGSLEGYGN